MLGVVLVVLPEDGGRAVVGSCLLVGARWVLPGLMAGVVRMRLLLGIVERAVSRRIRLFDCHELGME